MHESLEKQEAIFLRGMAFEVQGEIERNTLLKRKLVFGMEEYFRNT